MSLFSKFSKNHKELDTLASAVSNNAENNYKDAAQSAFKVFTKRFEELKEQNQLTEKQTAHYEELEAKFRKELEGFHH